MMGTGVTGESVERLRNDFYDSKYWAANSKYNKYNIQYDKLSELQTYMNEMSGDSGYTKWLSELSQSLQDIADNPAASPSKPSVIFTALLVPTNKTKINKPNSHPISKLIFKMLSVKLALPPPFI